MSAAGAVHRDTRLAKAFGGQLPADLGRLDRGDLGHALRVIRDVEAGPEADLDDVTPELLAHATALWMRLLHVARDIDDSRQDLLGVHAHCRFPWKSPISGEPTPPTPLPRQGRARPPSGKLRRPSPDRDDWRAIHRPQPRAHARRELLFARCDTPRSTFEAVASRRRRKRRISANRVRCIAEERRSRLLRRNLRPFNWNSAGRANELGRRRDDARVVEPRPVARVRNDEQLRRR